MFESIAINLVKQMMQITPETIGVWIPLGFGLAVGLVYAIISGARRSR